MTRNHEWFLKLSYWFFYPVATASLTDILKIVTKGCVNRDIFAYILIDP